VIFISHSHDQRLNDAKKRNNLFYDMEVFFWELEG
jgi:hypothetical protein